MQVRRIEIDETCVPEKITAIMSIQEATLIAKLVGDLVPSTAESHSIYDGLMEVFNRFWDDGVTEAARELGV